MAENAELKVAIIGAGYMATEHCKAFASIPGVKLCAILGRTKEKVEKLAAEYLIPNVCTSVAELYQKTQADLVVVTVPELALKEISAQCFTHPWTILLEKPAGYNLQVAESIAADATANKRKVFVALNRRFYSSTRAVAQDLQALTGPRFIRVEDQQNMEAALKSGQPAEVVKYWMYANSIHVIDYFRLLGRGRIQTVENICPWGGPETRVVLAKITFDSGDMGLYQGVWRGPGPWSVQVTTDEKRWELRPLEDASSQKFGERQVNKLERHAFDVNFKPGLRLQAEHAVAACRGEKNDLPTLAESLESMRLVHSIFGV